MTGPHAGHPTRWLCDGAPRRLADRLVAAGTHKPAVAAEVAATVAEIAELCDRQGPDMIAHRLFGPDGDPTSRARHHQILVSAAAAAQVPLWAPPPTGRRALQQLDPIQQGAIRAVARTRPDRIVPVAIAEQGATTAQMIRLRVDHFTNPSDHSIRVALEASAHSTSCRTIVLRDWATDVVAVHLAECQERGLRPCYRGHDYRPAKVAKSISARVDRVLADAGVAATAASLRFTAGHRALEAGGPVAAMQVLGVGSVQLALRFLDR